MRRRLGGKLERMGVVFALVAIVAGALVVYSRTGDKPLVIGKLRNIERIADATPAPTVTPTPSGSDPTPVPVKPTLQIAPHLLTAPAPAKPPPPPPDKRATNVPEDLKFFLVIGSDARTGQDMTHSRADSIHIVAVDPLVKRGAILGLPRDSYVDIPGHGKRKINAALALGGPDLLGETIRNVTGLPVEFYALTAFDGLRRMVNDIGGVDITVPYKMDDNYSGAHFDPGREHMDGGEVLSFTRARHGVPGGDFGRSLNHGRVMLDTLLKARKEISDDSGITKWMKILFKYAKLDMSLPQAIEFGKLARQLVPATLTNVVATGNSHMVGGQSVVELDDGAYALFRDIGADAMADGNTTRVPPPKTKPKPAPTPTPLLEDVVGDLLGDP